MKIGLDIHGVIDKHRAFFAEWACMLRSDNELIKMIGSARPLNEVHIMTGPSIKQLGPEELQDIWHTHFFSIVDYCNDIGVKVTWADSNNPWIDPKIWNSAKADYARKHKLDLVIDDSTEYPAHFTTPIAVFQAKK